MPKRRRQPRQEEEVEAPTKAAGSGAVGGRTPSGSGSNQAAEFNKARALRLQAIEQRALCQSQAEPDGPEWGTPPHSGEGTKEAGLSSPAPPHTTPSPPDWGPSVAELPSSPEVLTPDSAQHESTPPSTTLEAGPTWEVVQTRHEGK